MREKLGEFITNTSPRISGEANHMVILIIDGIEEENLSMVTVLCHHDQNKMDASNALSTLCQHHSPRAQCSGSKEMHQ